MQLFIEIVENNQTICDDWYDLSDFVDHKDLFEKLKEDAGISDLEGIEVKITDTEDVPGAIYVESPSFDYFEKLYKYIDFLDCRGLESLDTDQAGMLDLCNEYCDANYYEKIYILDDDFLNEMFNTPSEAANAIDNESFNMRDSYVTFDGYDNLVSSSNLEELIDINDLARWIWSQL